MRSEPKTSEEVLQSLNPGVTPAQDIDEKKAKICFLIYAVFVLLIFAIFNLFSWLSRSTSTPNQIKIVSMGFTAEVNHTNVTTQQTHYIPLTSAKWDLLIRVPRKVVGNGLCLQASFLYKNVTLVTSSIQSYNKRESGMHQLLNVSAVATKEDLCGAIGRDIMEVILKRSEVRFRSRLSFMDCREETKKGRMSYECDEATLRFELGSNKIKAAAFGKHPTCIFNL